MKMASRTIDLISKTPDCTCSTLFSNQQKIKNLHVQHAFCLSWPLFCITTTLFCRTKTSNFLVTHYFYGEIVVCAYPIFCLLCSSSLLFFTAAHFHLAGYIYTYNGIQCGDAYSVRELIAHNVTFVGPDMVKQKTLIYGNVFMGT